MEKGKRLYYGSKSILLVTLLIALSVVTIGAQTIGDANSNGTVDIVDALLIAQYYVGLNPSNFNSTNADADCSGSVSIVDALLVAQYYVGLLAKFPCALTPTPAPTATAGGNITVWLSGDSTMATGGSTCPVGYGSKLGAYFDSRVTVVNSARAGRSINQWLYNVLTTANSSGVCDITKDASGNPTVTTDWQGMLTGMKAGDYLLIAFGINDGTADCPRHTDEATFKADLGIMAAAAKQRGAIPIFMTPTSSISCNGSSAQGTRGAYVTYTIAAGQQYGVSVIDLHQLSVNLYNSLGFCPLPGGATDISATTGGAVGTFFCDDHTHFDTTGAVAIAQVIATAIRAQIPGLAAYLK